MPLGVKIEMIFTFLRFCLTKRSELVLKQVWVSHGGLNPVLMIGTIKQLAGHLAQRASAGHR